MTPAEPVPRQPAGPPEAKEAAHTEARARLERARAAMIATGQWDASQLMGRRFPIGCVALEITQRCNLDCSACYLSENSEAVKDLPLDEIFRRITMIRDWYGPGTAVQVTGGDPTMRSRNDLIAIVRRIRESGMLPSLFTNGIKATRGLLASLAEAGLADVAFHVDMSQGRRGYRDERHLNELRGTYIERARGLPIRVFFNTTVLAENFHQVPDIVRFLVRHSDVVSVASFQPAADTGRSRLEPPSSALDARAVIRQIERGANTPLSFDTARIGHSSCNRHALTFVINGRVYDLLDDKDLHDLVLARTAHLQFHGQSRRRITADLLGTLLKSPDIIARGAAWVARKLWQMRADLLATRGRVNKLSFFIHNFMDARKLDPERLDACVFMVATAHGPVSMCLHNAKRDEFILDPIRVCNSAGEWSWDPLSGRLMKDPRARCGNDPAGDHQTTTGISEITR